MKLFFTGSIQVFFVAVNTFFISKHFYPAIGVCGFMISFIWSFNIKKIAFGTMTDRLWYSAGAGVGSVVGTVVSVYIFNHL